MTDSSTSPVPPKEIEEAMRKLENAAVDLWRASADEIPYGPPGQLTTARDALRSAIASYTLSPEEARAILAVMDAAVVRNAAALHVDALDLGNGLVTLRRIASTEEASQ